MCLWKLCVVITMACVFSQTGQQSEELIDLVIWRAKDTLNEAANEDWPILDFVLHPGTCYTDRQIPCISRATIRATPSTHNDIIESYTDTVPFDIGGKPFVRTETPVRARFFAAILLPVNADTGGVVRAHGVKLVDILTHYYRRGAFLQGYVRLINALESAAIGFLLRFCQLMTVSVERRLTVDSGLIREFHIYLMVVLSDRFKYHFIFQTLIEVIRDVLTKLDRGVKDGKKLFELTMQEIQQRYGNMVGYVQLYQHGKDFKTKDEINEEIKKNMDSVVRVFGEIPEHLKD